jgi:hypothetical protein
MVSLRVALLALFLQPVAAHAEPVSLSLKLVNEAGKPLARHAVRVAIGSDAIVSAPGAGRRLTTDGAGHVSYRTETALARRTISSTSVFTRHPSEHLVVGVELELLGRRALYKIALDQLRLGTVGQMVAWLPGPDGRFDRMLTFHPQTHSWSLPDDPAGMRLSGIGAELRAHEMDGSPATGRTIALTIAKQTFRRR